MFFARMIFITKTIKFGRRDTHHDEQHEVNPVPERVSILHVVHNVYPSFQADYLEFEKKKTTIFHFRFKFQRQKKKKWFDSQKT